MYVSMIWIRYSIQELSSICAYVSASPQHLTCVTNAASGSGDSIPPVSQPNRVSTVIIADNRTPPQQQKPTLFLLWFQSNTTQSALLLQYQTCLFQRLDLTIHSHWPNWTQPRMEPSLISQDPQAQVTVFKYYFDKFVLFRNWGDNRDYPLCKLLAKK